VRQRRYCPQAVNLEIVDERVQVGCPIAGLEVVNRQRIPGSAENVTGFEHIGVGLDIRAQFEHHAIGGQHRRHTVEQQRTADVEERSMAAGQGVEPDTEQPFDDAGRGGISGCASGGRRTGRSAIQQLVPPHACIAVEDGLPCDEGAGA